MTIVASSLRLLGSCCSCQGTAPYALDYPENPVTAKRCHTTQHCQFPRTGGNLSPQSLVLKQVCFRKVVYLEQPVGKYPVSFYMDMFSGEIQAIIQSKNTLEQGCNIQAGLLCVKQQSPQTCTCTALAEHTGQEIRISSFNTSLLVNYIVAQDCPFIGFLFYLLIYLFI